MYKIGNFRFAISGLEKNYIPENFKKFETNEEPEYFYRINIVDSIDLNDHQFIVNKPTMKISINNNLETRYICLPHDTNIYAKCKEIDQNHTNIYFQKTYLSSIHIDTIFTSLFSLERRMYQHNHYVLHSSYIVYHDQAILFTAPSGVGKSTQASLWQKYRNIKIINGDRTLITKNKEK